MRRSGQSQQKAVDPELIYERVRRVPEGFVTTYGALCPGAPRHAGRALANMPPGLPWWRVVRADGSLAKGAEQARHLEAEGVPLRGKRVVLREALVSPEILR
jgi:methylated-DNA-protein-cysteine methyltransferase related protein